MPNSLSTQEKIIVVVRQTAEYEYKLQKLHSFLNGNLPTIDHHKNVFFNSFLPLLF